MPLAMIHGYEYRIDHSKYLPGGDRASLACERGMRVTDLFGFVLLGEFSGDEHLRLNIEFGRFVGGRRPLHVE